MREFLIQIVGQQPNDFLKRSVAREYLQARILEALQDRGVFTRWAFVGGTSLRFLFGLPRYSEDLDFSLVVPKKKEGFTASHAQDQCASSMPRGTQTMSA